MSDNSYAACNHCGGKGCDKCHQGWECTKFCEEYHPWYPLGSHRPLKDDHYGLECDFCTRGWSIGTE